MGVLMTVSKALLLNVGVFEANLNVRKNRGAYSLNYQNAANNISNAARDVPAGGGFTWQGVSDNPSVTMLRVTGGPVMVNVTLGVVTNVRTVPEVLTLVVNQFLVLDDNVQSVTVGNQGSSTVNVAITQG
jgi:hypothetical protein